MINILRRSIQRRRGARDGGAVAIEFAFLMAFMPLVIMALGIVDYGEVMAQTTNLAAIIRGAAEYVRGQVVQNPNNPLPQPSDLGPVLGVSAAVFSTASFCTCADNSSVSCPGAGGPNPCAKKPDKRVLIYVAVSGSQTYTPLVSTAWPFPPSVSARTVLRTQ